MLGLNLRRSVGGLAGIALLSGVVGLAAAADSPPRDPVQAEQIIFSMEPAYQGVNDYTMILKKSERMISGETVQEVGFVKVKKPKKIYFELIGERKRGQRAIYNPDLYQNKLIARAAGVLSLFSWKRLNPRSGMAMQDQHHTILETDLGETIRMITSNLKKGKERAEAVIVYRGVDSFEGRRAHWFELTSPPDASTIISVTDDRDTLWTIADREHQDMYVILYHNPAIRGPNGVKRGQQLMIPTYYGHRTLLWIDDELRLPLKLEIYDEQNRLYEKYEHSALKVNVGLREGDFNHKIEQIVPQLAAK